MDYSLDNNLLNFWQQCRQMLLSKMGSKSFELYIAPLQPLKYENQVLTLGVSPQRVFRQWLEDNYKPVIEACFASVTGEDCRVIFEDYQAVEETPAATRETAKLIPKVAKPVNPVIEHLNRHFKFENFVVGNCNQFARSAAMAVADAPGMAYNPLFLHSNSGLGKSHLLNAIAWHLVQMRPDISIECLTSEDFGNRYFEALSRNEMNKFRSHFRNLDVLLVDDIQFFVGKKNFQEELFHTFNSLFNCNKQIVITSDRPPREIDGLAERLVSRFECGLTAQITTPDVETRLAILRSKQQAQNIKFSNAILEHIASRVKSNVRRLEGALFNLVYSCTVFNISCSAVTTDFLDEHLQGFFSEEIFEPVTLEQIQKAVAEHYSLKLADMTSKRRPANIAYPRQVAMFLARKLTGLSLPAIADGFRKTHATVIHAVKSVEEKYSSSAEARREIDQIERQIQD